MDTHGLEITAVIATILYSAIGTTVMIVSLVIFDKVFGLNLKHELVEDNNIAFGVLLGCVAIGISIIIAAAIM